MKFKVQRISGIRGRKKKNSKKETDFTQKIKQILKYFGLLVVTLALMFMVYSYEQTGIWFKASILEAPQPFNGTALPVAQVPNFEYWGTQKSNRFNEIDKKYLVSLPKYDTGKLTFPDSELKWGDRSQDEIRNSKIAYSVVYMGNYKLDHIEGNGSHPAVDIKMPIGTPLHAIANGKVTKVKIQSTGFGNHVVIKHPNVPDPENPGKLTTVYSSYSHMDRIDVTEGQNVLKGQIVGTSGNSGTSTTPHVHFQMDRDTAPWHPYWPFTWAESQAAGLSFFEAVNAGLGKENGQKHTIHPMAFSFKHLNHSALVTSNEKTTTSNENETANTEETNEKVVEEIVEEVVEKSEEKSEESKEINENKETIETVKEGVGTELFSYKIEGETISLVGNGINLIVSDDKNQIENIEHDTLIKAEIEGVGELLQKNFTKKDFNNGALRLTIRSSKAGYSNVRIGKSSYRVEFIEGVKSASKFKIEHDGYFIKNEEEIIEVIALDEEGNKTPSVNFPGFANLSTLEGSATLEPVQLQARDFKGGIAKIKVKSPDEKRIKIRIQNGALVGESSYLRAESENIFTDVNKNHKNFTAIKYLKEKDILSGYSDGSFKPNNIVNRVEALKMLMLAFNIEVDKNTKNISFKDTQSNAWYASTLSTAVNKGIVKGYDDGSFKPANTVIRAEYLKILMETAGVKTEVEIIQPYIDVETSSWFAKYAFMANKMNLLDASTKLWPEKGMTRAEVAETIYRLRVIQDENLLTFSK